VELTQLPPLSIERGRKIERVEPSYLPPLPFFSGAGLGSPPGRAGRDGCSLAQAVPVADVVRRGEAVGSRPGRLVGAKRQANRQVGRALCTWGYK